MKEPSQETKNISLEVPQIELDKLSGLYQSGQMLKLEQQCNKLLQLYPDSVILLNILGASLKDQGKTLDAVMVFNSIIDKYPNYTEAYNNLGFVLTESGEYDQAIPLYLKAISLRADYVEAINNLGTTHLKKGNLLVANEYFEKCLLLNSNYIKAYYNIINCLILQGELDKALEFVLSLDEKIIDELLVKEVYIRLLNIYTIKISKENKYISLQLELNQINHLINNDSSRISTLISCYLKSRTLVQSRIGITSKFTQIYRGKKDSLNCSRHKLLFEKHMVIPKHCFRCYKVIITVDTVVNLFKLFMIFNNIELPNDNTRKCMIELRDGVVGTYKGFIYCQSHSDAYQVFQIANDIVKAKLNDSAQVRLKRGCSEYARSFPRYQEVLANESNMMKYDMLWMKYEENYDEQIDFSLATKQKYTYNHTGLTISDIMCMYNWLSYAKGLGDNTYIDIDEFHQHKMQLSDRRLIKSCSKKQIRPSLPNDF